MRYTKNHTQSINGFSWTILSVVLWVLAGMILLSMTGCDNNVVYYHSEAECLVVHDRCYDTAKDYALAEGISIQTAIDNFRHYQLEAKKKEKMKEQLRKQEKAYVDAEKRYDSLTNDISNHNLSK